jgi:hypothetical protein
MSEELKPCPCCGGHADVVGLYSTWPPYKVAVKCEECGLQTDYFKNELHAVLSWNIRQETTPNMDVWINVEQRLPEEHGLGMSKDVLTLAGIKQSVKSYDYELKRWNGSPHVTITHWMPLPQQPKTEKP